MMSLYFAFGFLWILYLVFGFFFKRKNIEGSQQGCCELVEFQLNNQWWAQFCSSANLLIAKLIF